MSDGLFGKFNIQFPLNIGFLSSISSFTTANVNMWGGNSVFATSWLHPLNWINSLKYSNNSIMNFGGNTYLPSMDTVNFGGSSAIYSSPYVTPRTTPSSRTQDSKTPEEKAAETKVNALKSLLNSYAVYIEDETLKNDIKDIASDSTINYQEKLEELQKLKNENISDISLASYIKNHSSIKFDDKAIKDILSDIGYDADGIEFRNLTLNHELLNGKSIMHSASAYNNADRNIVDDALAIKDKDERRKTLQTLRNNLLEEAKVQAANLKSENKYYSELEKMDVNDSKFAEEFNKVYAYTRIIAAKSLNQMLDSKYGIQSETFADNTKSDLAGEKGIKQDDITAALAFEVKANAGMKPIKSGAVSLKGSTDEKLEKLLDARHLTEAEEINVNDLPYQSYLCITGDRYIKKGDAIHKVEFKDGNWVDAGEVNPKMEFEDVDSPLQKKLAKIITPEKQAADEEKILENHPELEVITEISVPLDGNFHNVFKAKNTDLLFIVYDGKLKQLNNAKLTENNEISPSEENKAIEYIDMTDDDLRKKIETIIMDKAEGRCNYGIYGELNSGETLYHGQITGNCYYIKDGELYILNKVKRNMNKKTNQWEVTVNGTDISNISGDAGLKVDIDKMRSNSDRRQMFKEQKLTYGPYN